MLWSELKKYKIEEIVIYINKKLIELGSLQAISKLLEVDESTIRKKLNSNGYKRKGNEFVLKDDTCNLSCNTVENIQQKEHEESNMINVFKNTEFKENMFYLNNEIDTLKKIIETFKQKDDKSNSDVIELIEGVKINLPESNIKRTTIRINEKVWDLFNELVEENKPIDKHDLMSMALLEYINKYKRT